MRTEISEVEHYDLFTNHIKKLRHENEELNKMLEARLEHLTKSLCDNDLNNSSYKSLRSETFRSIDAAEGLMRLLYKRLNENIEKSFIKLEKLEVIEDERHVHKA